MGEFDEFNYTQIYGTPDERYERYEEQHEEGFKEGKDEKEGYYRHAKDEKLKEEEEDE